MKNEQTFLQAKKQKTNKQTDKQTNKQNERHTGETDTETDRQIDKYTNRQIYRQTEWQADRLVVGHVQTNIQVESNNSHETIHLPHGMSVYPPNT